MKCLLDTHTLLWALEDNPILPEHIRDMILDENNTIYLSSISLFEISLKHKKNPGLMQYTANQIIDYSSKAGYIFLSISHESIMMHEKIDYGNHKDPFDQFLIAQSVANEMKLITHDEAIAKISPQSSVYF